VPEGDTILRTARALRKVLAGRVVVRADSQVEAVARARFVGARITDVEARGKNLLVRFEDGRALHTHMQMQGSWHVYRPGERWRASPALARVVLEVQGAVAVCFRAPIVRLLSPAAERRDRMLTSLGPDILADDFDPRVAVKRLRASRFATRPVGEALLAQNAVAGIGNIYKSEALFAARQDPRTPTSALDDACLVAILGEARRLMRENLTTPVRTTRARPPAFGVRAPGERYWVYRRAGRPCAVCRAPIARIRQGVEGTPGRSTYYCPRCQKASSVTKARPAP
jgi:endonuclease-8